LAAVVTFAFYCCTVSGPADVQDQFAHHFYLPAYSEVTHPGVLDLHAAEEERAQRTEGSDDSSEGSYTVSYSTYLYSWLDDCF